jgi:lipid II:glycine glycyltransferase (peptidoglycan interpeptide bridge formation enzyme)
MALKLDVSIDPAPLDIPSESGDILFSNHLALGLYPDSPELQFVNVKGDDLTLSFPVIMKGGVPGKRIVMPQYMPWVTMDFQKNPTLSTAKQTSVQRHVTSAIVKELDKHKPVLLELNFLPFYWLPFYWAGYEVKPRVSYRLETVNTTPEKLFSGFRENIRRQIKKSEKEQEIRLSGTYKTLFELNKASYERKGDDHPFDPGILEKLFTHLHRHETGQHIEVLNKDQKPVAAALFAWDAHQLYYLTGGVTESEKSSGAMARVLWEGIKIAHSKGLTFDFEGSMNKGIEQFFSAFGATAFTYFQVRKSNSKLYDLYQSIRS